ncbi:trypsin-like serine peptidase (plasmid) [Streptomyces sp. BI20]|uniref:trypsin-like serine peptidase n=1 Tax=Streptomyces sp. BI20 TaxID=3403460 RepID=UPI003C727716
MSGLRGRHSFTLGIAATAALLLFPAATAVQAADVGTVAVAAAKAAPTTAVEHTVPTGSGAGARIARYWTPERMAAAIPVEPVGRASAPDGAARAPQAPTGPATTGADPVAGTAADTDGVKLAVTATRVVGKVFFTGSDGVNRVCSGSAVNSTNKNMVLTAGHCVHGGPGKSWATNWQFVPYYDHGSRPYGSWQAETLVAFNGWTNSGDFGYDLGIVITSPTSRGELVNAVGGLGIQWNQSKSRSVVTMGYPQDPPFDGQWQYYCTGTTAQRSGSVTNQIKLPCTLTGGSSGGPWIYGKDDATYYSGWVNGVNSNVNDAKKPTEMRSPYFATWVGDAFTKYSSY